MNNKEQDLDRLCHSVEQLTRVAESGEQRMHRLERLNRGLMGTVAGLFGLVLYLGFNPAGGTPAHAENFIQKLEHAVEADIVAVEQEVEKVEQEVKNVVHSVEDAVLYREAQLKKKVEAIHHDITQGTFEAEKAIFAMLHGIKEALDAVPQMAEDMHAMRRAMDDMNHKMSAMPAMAADMHQMNGKMGIMAHDVNRTMGKMGSWMPMPWAP